MGSDTNKGNGKRTRGMKQEMAIFLGTTNRTIYNWKDQGRKVISFMEKYLSREDLAEFNTTGRCKKFDACKIGSNIDFSLLVDVVSILRGIEYFVKKHKTGREGFLIKFHYALKKYSGGEDGFPAHCTFLSIEHVGNPKNVNIGDSFDDVRQYYIEYMSPRFQRLLIKEKDFILPPLKSMRKYS